MSVRVREREQCGNTDKWDIYQHPTRQTQIYCARILFKPARFFFISMHHFALQVSCLLAHCFGFNHSLLVLCYSQPSQHFSGGGPQFSEDQLKSNLLPVRHLLCTKQQTTSKHTAINIK